MNTAQVAFTVAGSVLFAAVVAAFVLLLHGTRKGYRLSHSVTWGPAPQPRQKAAAVPPGMSVPEQIDRDFVERRAAS